MYRRNLDIAVAAIIAILGGLAAAAKLPGTFTIPLGVGLFFAPGYLWSEAILSQRLTGFERVMTSAGLAFIFPIIGGFLFYGLKIPLLKSAWIGLLVVLTLLGVVAVAVQRLRAVPVDPRQQQQQRQQQQRNQQQRNQQAPRSGGLSVVHAGVFGLAAVIGLGSVAFSINNAEAQKFPGQTALGMTAIVPNAQSYVGSALSAGNPAAMYTGAKEAHLNVMNREGVTEQYLVTLTLSEKKKVTKTWNFTLADNETWQVTIPYTLAYKMVAAVYIKPNISKPYTTVDNGT
jgi:hypothetical protein